MKHLFICELALVTRSFCMCVVWGLAARGVSRKVTGIVVVGIIFFIQSLFPGPQTFNKKVPTFQTVIT